MSERTERIYTERCKPTNAEVIRAMSDEELATFLFNNIDCSDCTMHGVGCSIDCEQWMLSWLKSPAEKGEQDG